MIDLRQRSREAERLDVGVEDEEAVRSLGDLRLVNRWLGGRRSLLRAVRPFLQEGIRVLDVGCGSADLPAWLQRTTPSRIMVVGVDLKLLHLQQAPPGVHRVVADVRQLPFPPLSFDVVTVSLFLHHFDAPEVGGVLRALFSLARRALVVNDLRRARVPLLFGQAVFPFLFRSPVSVADGLVSVRRGFRPQELAEAFASADLRGVRIWRRFPYRLVAVAERGGNGGPGP
ncbi:MAG TPA: methyltransferase domain-containing protein [Vicinamibacteria bacterium]|nr:methyltransferase domain-containing protein [Vicinamibacteria bacterium]